MSFRQRIERVVSFGSLILVCVWIFRALYGIAVGIYTGHAREVLMPWIWMLVATCVGEVLGYLYLNYYPSTFSDHRAIDAPPEPEPPKVEQFVLKFKKMVQVFFVITVTFMIALNAFEDLTGKIGWHVAFAIWVIVLTGFMTWLLILELYIRYASSILSERNVTPVPFTRRRARS